MCRSQNMFENVKKSIEKIRGVNPKELWVAFSQAQKVNRRDYIDMLTSDVELQSIADDRRLEAKVGEEIRTDFPGISDSSYQLLLDATMHSIRKQQLQATEDIRFE